MRKVVVVCLLVGALALGLLVPQSSSAPAPADKPVRYEYAELSFARSFAGGPGGGFAPPIAMPVGPGGVAMPPPNMPGLTTAIRWTTAEEQVEVKEWEELADKLKAPAAKKESPAAVHKLRVLNRLSELGWEVLDRPLLDTTGAATVAFRRRLP